MKQFIRNEEGAIGLRVTGKMFLDFHEGLLIYRAPIDKPSRSFYLGGISVTLNEPIDKELNNPLYN